MHLLSKIKLEKRYAPTRSIKLNLVLPCTLLLTISMFIHVIMSFHLLCIHDTYFVHMHAIGAPEGVTLLEFEPVNPEEQQGEPQVTTGGGPNLEDLLECPDHQPASFLKGKPRSILSLLCFHKHNLSSLCLMH
jgi:hypothetical protein